MPRALYEQLDTVVTAKLPRAILERLHKAARAHDRTLSGQVRRVLREWCESDQPTPPQLIDEGADR
jgi:hypothetical protein